MKGLLPTIKKTFVAKLKSSKTSKLNHLLSTN